MYNQKERELGSKVWCISMRAMLQMHLYCLEFKTEFAGLFEAVQYEDQCN